MSKPVIVFNLDDTLFETSEWFNKYLNVMGVAYPQTDDYREDNPTAVRTAKDQVIIYDRPWNRNITNAPRIYGLDGLMPAIENLTWPN